MVPSREERNFAGESRQLANRFGLIRADRTAVNREAHAGLDARRAVGIWEKSVLPSPSAPSCRKAVSVENACSRERRAPQELLLGSPR